MVKAASATLAALIAGLLLASSFQSGAGAVAAPPPPSGSRAGAAPAAPPPPAGNCGNGALEPSAGAVTPANPAHWTQDEISRLWIAESGPPAQAQIAGAVGMAESGGNPNAVGPPTRWGQAIGLMQILGAV